MNFHRPRIRETVAFAASAALIAGCGSASAPSAGTHGHRVISIFQSDALVQYATQPTLLTIKQLGATVVRTGLYWSQVAPDPSSRTKPSFDPSDPSSYPQANWAVWDNVDRLAHEDGLTPFFTITGNAPLWATGPGAPRNAGFQAHWEPSDTEFEAFVKAVGTRYSGHYTPPGASSPLPRVNFWSVWNEPNDGVDLAPQMIDNNTVQAAPRLYRGLVDAAWKGLQQSGHTTSTDTILIGETAPHGIVGPGRPGLSGYQVPLPFIESLYCLSGSLTPLSGSAASAVGCPASSSARARFAAENPGLFHATGFAVHPYEELNGPAYRPPLALGYGDFGALPDLEHVLDRAAGAYGVGAKLPIYNTEFGYHTKPPGDPYGALPVAQAAAYMNQTEYLSWINPRIRSFDQYLLQDPAPNSGSAFVSGLELYNGVPKPIYYDAYRLPLWLPKTTEAANGSLEVWGCARGANATKASGQVAIEFQPASGGGWQVLRRVSLTAAGGCYFDVRVRFPSSGTVRLGYDEAGTRLHSRTQSITRQ